jgi:hypothetical protein
MTTQLPFSSSASNRVGIAQLNNAGHFEVRCLALRAGVLCHAQKLAHGDRLVTDGIVVLQPFRRKIDTVMTRNESKAV